MPPQVAIERRERVRYFCLPAAGAVVVHQTDSWSQNSAMMAAPPPDMMIRSHEQEKEKEKEETEKERER